MSPEAPDVCRIEGNVVVRVVLSRRAGSIREYRDLVLSVHGPTAASARLVALGLAKYMGDQSMSTFVSANKLATEAVRMSERAVRTHIAALVRDGWIVESIEPSGQAHWRRLRQARIPVTVPEAGLVAVNASATRGAEVAANGSGTSGEVAAI